MAVKVNAPGVAQARSFIAEGKINGGAWSFTAADGDKLLGPNGDDWPNFAKYHLAEHPDQPEKTKARYGYPYGKAGEVYKRGVEAAKSRAAQQGDKEVEARAAELLNLIEEKSEAPGADTPAEEAAETAPKKSVPIDEIRARRDLLEGMFERATVDEQSRTVAMSFSSEEPVERFYGNEILSHARDAVNLDRLGSGRANLLVNHDPSDWVGVVQSASVGDDKKGRAVVKFGNSQRASEVFRDVKDGILTSVSVGYMRDDMKLTGESKDGPDTYTVTRWTPFEVSLVTVPADQTVGVGRSAAAEAAERARVHAENEQQALAEASRRAAAEVPTKSAASAAIKEHAMTPEEQAAADAAARTKITAVQAEKERRQAIINLCKASKIDPRVEEQWIRDGTTLTEVADGILEVEEERSKQRPHEAARLGLTSRESQRWSLFRAMRHLNKPADPKFREEAAFEIECTAELERKNPGLASGQTKILVPSEILHRELPEEAARRAMGMRALDITPGSKGGYLVAVDQMDFIGILRNRSVAMRMGARVLSGLQGNLVFPRQTGKPSVTWQGGGGTSVSAADQTLGQLSMTPKTAIVITDVSIQLLQQASPSAEAFVMADLAADIAIDGVDNASINGTGGAQPLGIKNTTGITSGQDASSATYAKILAFPQTAGSANAILGNPGFVTNTAGASRLMQVQRFTSTDTPLWVGNMLDGMCVGFNAMSSEQLASANLIFGSWDTLVIGEWGVLQLDTDTGGTRFNQGQVGIRALWMVDVMLRYPTAWVVGTNLS
jgi:HK97 family phage major capsid protein/HK97 family phage prohead protease